jgi:glycine cleavage system H protein
MQIDQYEFPDDLFYDIEHNWARIEGGQATIGLTAFGQDLAGEIVYAEVPRTGRDITQGQPFMSLESGKWVGRVKAIVSGTIVEANEEIEWESTLINDDPYGEGWFAKVELAGEPEGLMKPSDPEFAELIAAEREKYGK